MNIYDRLGVRRIINAKGPATRLSGAIMRPEIAQAMAEASRACVDMAELQAAASKAIAKATGAEAGYVASGASASLLLATAACIAGLDPGRMSRLPDTRGMKNEVIMVRSQRNFYDHAIRAAGATIVEVGLPDRYAGAGVRDAEAWEIADAIGERTAAIFYVADSQSRPTLKEIARLAGARKVPVIVDAAAQLPPQSNLKRFIAEGADLVAFSGGKAIGGPQASGILCGRRDFVMSAALQHLDLDIHADMWEPPATLIDKRKLKGTPQHGIGRSCKAGKEEIVGLLVALELFIAEGDAARHARWLRLLQKIRDGVGTAATLTIRGADDRQSVPVIEMQLDKRLKATAIALKLQRGKPSIHLDPVLRDRNCLVINPMCLAPGDVAPLVAALKTILARKPA
ncbi:MAG: aminotransferase class V-fold PLP-dependent enzyme [Rhizobiales bacterium]|nr:aminotransferase class V-fold PLP-dependent enzyme [Hyphomicrobiales bacterium]MBI3673873.1 aminotransferase class V-fold PLP-dependent enzyme [Hyphomicrobiales bacterium]